MLRNVPRFLLASLLNLLHAADYGNTIGDEKSHPNELLKLRLIVSLASAISAPVVVQGACFDACKCMSLPVRMKRQM